MKPHFLYLVFFLIVLVVVSGCTQPPQPDQNLLAGGADCRENSECQSSVCDLYKQEMGKCAPLPCAPEDKTNHGDFYCGEDKKWHGIKQEGEQCNLDYECFQSNCYEAPGCIVREKASCRNNVCVSEPIEDKCGPGQKTIPEKSYGGDCSDIMVRQANPTVCAPCGNGVCDEDLEDECNCPEDCEQSELDCGEELEGCTPDFGIPNAAEQPATEWEEGGAAVSGKYADADVVDLGGGKYRMYFSAEPEVQNFEGQVYSAVSTDGKKWTVEDGERRRLSTFPDVLKLPDGKWRMYFQSAGEIKSAVSSDGLTWTDEEGTRIKAEPFEGQAVDNVAAPTTFLLEDGTYIMVYRITINKRYEHKDMVPNPNTQLFLWATSKDGLNFQKKGIALDSRREPFLGLLDGPDLVDFEGEIRLYFWTYRGAYHVVFEGDGFSQEPEFDYITPQKNPLNKFPENPPGDPTLIKIGSTWYMYYGSHTKGIYYATLKVE